MSELIPVGLTAQLSFSDIIHPLPPSPQDSQNRPESPGIDHNNSHNAIGSNEHRGIEVPHEDTLDRPESPEPVGATDVRGMKKRVLEMGFGREGGTEPSDASLRESILADMVLKLTDMIEPMSDQLHAQAQLISQLMQQRDMLLARMEEEQTKWQAEKEGFTRMAEALIRKRGSGGFMSEEDHQGVINSLNFDNRALRLRLQDAQLRLAGLEADLAALKPALLLQSPAPATSRRSYQRKVAHPPPEEPITMVSSLLPSAAIGPTTPATLVTPSPYYKPRPGAAFSPAATSHKQAPSSMSADARSEHILLAAKRLGKERTMHAHLNLPPPPEQLSPRTPKRGRPPNQANANGPPTTRTPKGVGLTYAVQSYASSSANGASNRRGGAYPSFPTPSHQTPTPALSSMPINGSPLRASHTTPGGVQNLLNAARVLSDQEEDGDIDMDGDLEMGGDESEDGTPSPPKAKRRKVDSSKAGHPPGRERSMLELLADQAAVFSSGHSATADSPTPVTPSFPPPLSPRRSARTRAPVLPDGRVSPSPLSRRQGPSGPSTLYPTALMAAIPTLSNSSALAHLTMSPSPVPTSISALTQSFLSSLTPVTNVSTATTVSLTEGPLTGSGVDANPHLPGVGVSGPSPTGAANPSTVNSGKGKGKARGRSPAPSSSGSGPAPLFTPNPAASTPMRVPYSTQSVSQSPNIFLDTPGVYTANYQPRPTNGLPPAMSRLPLPPLPSATQKTGSKSVGRAALTRNMAPLAKGAGTMPSQATMGGAGKIPVVLASQSRSRTPSVSTPIRPLAPPVRLSSEGPSRASSAPLQAIPPGNNDPVPSDPTHGLIPVLTQLFPGLLGGLMQNGEGTGAGVSLADTTGAPSGGMVSPYSMNPINLSSFLSTPLSNVRPGDSNSSPITLSDAEVLKQLQRALTQQPGYDPTRPDPLTTLVAQLANGTGALIGNPVAGAGAGEGTGLGTVAGTGTTTGSGARPQPRKRPRSPTPVRGGSSRFDVGSGPVRSGF